MWVLVTPSSASVLRRIEKKNRRRLISFSSAIIPRPLINSSYCCTAIHLHGGAYFLASCKLGTRQSLGSEQVVPGITTRNREEKKPSRPSSTPHRILLNPDPAVPLGQVVQEAVFVPGLLPEVQVFVSKLTLRRLRVFATRPKDKIPRQDRQTRSPDEITKQEHRTLHRKMSRNKIERQNQTTRLQDKITRQDHETKRCADKQNGLRDTSTP